MNKSSPVLSLLVIGLLVAGAYYLYQDFKQSTQGILQPYQQANATLQAQVSNLINPTPTIIPDPATYIHEIRSLARLETIQYSIEKVITAEIGQGTFGALFGDRLLFVGHGIVIAGVDLAKMNPEDLLLQNDILYVRLPPAEVFIATLDNQKSYVYDRQTGVLTHGDQNLESTARQAAEAEIMKAAVDDGILNVAQQNAESFMLKFFSNLGFDTVQFVH